LIGVFGTGDLTGAESHLRRAGARTDETGTIEWIRGIASGALSGLYLWRGYGEEKRAGASILSGPTLCSYLATAQYALGYWDDAAITVHQALSVQSDHEQPQHRTLVQLAATLVPAGRGDWATANRHVAEAKKWAHKIGTPQDLRYAAIAAAILAQAKADHAGMAEALRLVRYIEPGVAGPHTWWQTWWLPLLVEALIGVGALDEAERKPRQLQYSLQDVSNVADTTCLLRATLARTQGRTEQALLIYQRHVDSTRDQPHLPFPREARTRLRQPTVDHRRARRGPRLAPVSDGTLRGTGCRTVAPTGERIWMPPA
jgi:tetratricopeptide (TPR) repeat protein